MVNLYSAPGSTPSTSADHVPRHTSPGPPSLASGVASLAQPSKVPVTKTAVAWGAQTRNVVPRGRLSGYGIAPIPGRAEVDGALIASERTTSCLEAGARCARSGPGGRRTADRGRATLSESGWHRHWVAIPSPTTHEHRALPASMTGSLPASRRE